MKAARMAGTERVFQGNIHAARDRMLNAAGTKGGYGTIRRRDGAPLYSPISFIPLGLSSTHRTPSCRFRKIGEDESDPPRKAGGHVAPIAARCGTPLSGPMGVALVLMDPCGKAQNRPQRGR